VTAVAARRAVVRQLQERGLSERQALRLVGMSASTLRYQRRDDGNARLRERLTELAGQHCRHGYRMLHSRLRIDGWTINVKRTYWVYREEGLIVRKRRRKKLPVPERQPLVRPIHPNEVWSMDFVFDELANGRRVKTRRSWTTAARRRCRSRRTPRCRRCCSEVVVFELVAHGQDGYRRGILDFKQRHVAAVAERDHRLTQESVVASLAVDERGPEKAPRGLDDRAQDTVCDLEVRDGRCAVQQVLVQALEVFTGRGAVANLKTHARDFFCSFVRALSSMLANSVWTRSASKYTPVRLASSREASPTRYEFCPGAAPLESLAHRCLDEARQHLALLEHTFGGLAQLRVYAQRRQGGGFHEGRTSRCSCDALYSGGW